jgi:hypothetical protein
LLFDFFLDEDAGKSEMATVVRNVCFAPQKQTATSCGLKKPGDFMVGPIMKSTSSEDLISANEGNLCDIYRFLALKGGRTLVEEADVSWVIAKPSWPNFIFDPHFDPQEVSERLDQIVTAIKDFAAPPTIKLGVNGKPDHLAEILIQKDFELFLSHPAMVADLNECKLDFQKSEGVSIEIVDTIEKLSQWCGVSSGFECSLYEKVLSEPNLRLYLGLLNGKAVGRSTMFYSSGVAGLYNVLVLPEFRNQGIGTALTKVPLINALEMGFQISTLQASPMGEPIYRRIGFERLFDFTYYRFKQVSFGDFMKH